MPSDQNPVVVKYYGAKCKKYVVKRTWECERNKIEIVPEHMKKFDDDRLNNMPKTLYEGQVKSTGEAHGIGRVQYYGGGIYEGEFYDGEKHGFGRMIYQNGASFSGRWFKGWWHGEDGYYQDVTYPTTEGSCSND